jgi:hypothetical protein
VFKHIAIALPAGLSHAGRASLSRDIVATLEQARLPYVAAIQRPSAQRGAKDARNFHLQLVVSNRPLLKAGPNGWEFGLLKDLETLGPAGLSKWRAHIVECFNSTMATEGLAPCFTALTRAERGLSSRTASVTADTAEHRAVAAKAAALLPHVNASIAGLQQGILHATQLTVLDADRRLATAAGRLGEAFQASIAAVRRKSELIRQVNFVHRMHSAARAALADGMARLQQLHSLRSSVLDLNADERVRKIRTLYAAAAGAAALCFTEARVRLDGAAGAKQLLEQLDANRTLRIVAQVDSRQLAGGLSRLAQHRRDLGNQQVVARLEQSVTRIGHARRQAMERRQGAIIGLQQLKSKKEMLATIDVDERLTSAMNRTMSIGRGQLGFAANNRRQLTMVMAEKTISQSVMAMMMVTTTMLASYAQASGHFADGNPAAPRRRIDFKVRAVIGAAHDKLAATRTRSEALHALKAAAQLKVAGERMVHGTMALLERGATNRRDLDALNVARRLDAAYRAYQRERAMIMRQMEAGLFLLRNHWQQADDLEKQQAWQRFSAHAEKLQASEMLRLTALHEMAARLHGIRKRIEAASVRANYAQPQLPAVGGATEAGGHKSSILGDLLKIFRKPGSPEPKMEEPAPTTASPPVVEPPTPITLADLVPWLVSPDESKREVARSACMQHMFRIFMNNPDLRDVPPGDWRKAELFKSPADHKALVEALDSKSMDWTAFSRFERAALKAREFFPAPIDTSRTGHVAPAKPNAPSPHRESPQQDRGSSISPDERQGFTPGVSQKPLRKPGNGPEIG